MKAKKLLKTSGKYLLLAIILLWSGTPILLVTLSSFKDARYIFEFPPKIFFKPTTENYSYLVKTWPEFFSSLRNSVIITVGAALLTVVVSFFAGYAYSRFHSRKLTMSAFFLLIIRMFPPIIITVPLYPIIRALNLFDKHITLVIFYSAFYASLGTWLMKSFMDQIPRELEEAAYMDGATMPQILAKIVFPLAKHGMMATATFVIIYAWKEYLFAMLFTTTRAKTAPLILGEMLGSVTGVQWGSLFAAATIQLIPILIYIYFAQNVLIEGATVGSVKG